METKHRKYRIIFSGGGTGGHLYPAIAIAHAFRRRFPESEILFVGARGKMEMEKVPLEGYKIEALNISGLQRKDRLKNLTLPFKIIHSLIRAGTILKEFKPDMVVGTGGYAAFPLMYKAAKKKIPSLIQEQNYFPGISNKYLSRYVDKICVPGPGLEKFFPQYKMIITGNPVRSNIRSLENKEESCRYFGLDDTKKVILVLGGSLGARSVNNAIMKKLTFFEMHDIQLIWQTGKLYFEEMKAALPGHKLKCYISSFISEMGKAYNAADLVISRAGAISISELALNRKAAILIPSPNVAEDHQTKNAEELVSQKAAILIRDNEVEEKLSDVISGLINAPEHLRKLSENIGTFARENAAEHIVDEMILILNEKQ
jgi:UDP-N-acetylglucosamine--N-acetylmuramyl-(pentapeptide) pyrophosphoryl-undecaprenol N-acetylglucosamine transferase